MKKKQSFIGGIIGFVAVISFAFYEQLENDSVNDVIQSNLVIQKQSTDDNAHLRAVIAEQKDGVMVSGKGQVTKVLPDDRDGSAHQRFIVQLASGETLLIAHNIDLAPRLPNLAENDRVAFKGQFETNRQGGVIHWTHKDPQGHHVGGWLDYKGKRYQ